MEKYGYKGGVPLRLALPILLLLIALASVPVWNVEYPPIVDYPLHMARAYLLSLPQDGQGITEFYRAHWIPIPNLGMDILVSLMMKVMTPMVAGKVFLTLVIGLLLSGGFALATALHKKVTVAAFLPVVALYDQWFLMGFANYLLGLGLGLWAMALWVASERWPARKRLLAFGAACCVIFVCHLMALLVTLGAVWAFESVRTKGMRSAMLGAGVGSTVTCLLAFIGLTATHRTPIQFTGRAASIVQGVSPAFDGWLWLTLVPLLLFVPIMPGSRLNIDRRAQVAAIGLGVVCLLGPSFMGGTAFACDRLTLPTFIIALVSLGETASGAWADNAPVRRSRIAIAIVAVTLKAIALWPYWTSAAGRSHDLVTALTALPERSTLVSFQLGPSASPTWRDLRHAPDWTLIHRPVFVAQNFTKVRQQPMKFTEPFEPFHVYQVNNPKEVADVAALETELRTVGTLQSGLESALSGQNRTSAGLYALVLFVGEAPESLQRIGETVARGPGFVVSRLK
ncbi:MAG: hypothetical protein JST30_05970 [Armatimonadetes bacterium]|nr:hypothetical protein [Armatimonadota bacterium]